jgi:hypothetical protein
MIQVLASFQDNLVHFNKTYKYLMEIENLCGFSITKSNQNKEEKSNKNVTFPLFDT